MPLAVPTLLLFGLNLLDALLTILWVRTGVATESNQLMAALLDIGNGPFLAAKLLIGTVTAIVLIRGGNKPLARYGVTIALALYFGLMVVHLFTGLTAIGYISSDLFQGQYDIPFYVAAITN